MSKRRSRLALVCLVCAVLTGLLAGCATMPDSGPVKEAANNGDGSGAQRVQIYPEAPTRGEQPGAIVSGFLEALASDEPNFATADKYLTTAARRVWNPTSQTIVVDDTAEPTRVGDSNDYALVGTEVGALDGHGFYQAAKQDYRHDFRLSLQDGEWRISAPPSGIVLHQLDFQRMYDTPYSLYYPDPYDPDDQVIPCQVYVRDGDGTATTLTRTFLEGPCPALNGLLPQPPQLSTTAARRSIAVNGGAAQIQLVAAADGLGRPRLTELAAALCATLQQVGVSGVQLNAGSQTITLSANSSMVARYATSGSTGSGASSAYFVDGGRAYRYDGQHAHQLPFGSGLADHVRVGTIAVSPEDGSIAAVSADGTKLYVGSPMSAKPAQWYIGSGLASPTWDALGDLWLLANDGSSTVMLRFAADTSDDSDAVNQPAVVSLGLVPGTVRRVRVAPDGVRCALLYDTPTGVSAAAVVFIRPTPPDRENVPHPTSTLPEFVATYFEPVLRQFGTVDDIAWSSPRTLTAVGKLQRAVSQVIEESYDDGSPMPTSPPALPSTTTIAAAAGAPLLAAQDLNGHQVIDELSGEGAWQQIAAGSAPVYPG